MFISLVHNLPISPPYSFNSQLNEQNVIKYPIDANFKVQRRLVVVCQGMQSPKKFMQRRTEIEAVDNAADEAAQKNGRKSMDEIEEVGSATLMIRNGSPKNKPVSRIRPDYHKGYAYVHENITELGSALQLFDEMLQSQPQPSIRQFNHLISVVVKMGHFSPALSLLNKLQLLGISNMCSISISINCYCHLNHMRCGFAMLGRIFKLGYVPDIFIFNTLIHGLCKEKMIDDALKLLQVMIDKRILPDVITYSSLIQGLSHLGRWREVMEMLDEMCQEGIYPDVITYNILVDAYCKEGKMKQAEDIILRMNQSGERPDVVTYNSLMDGYCLPGKMSEADKVIRSMEHTGIVPNIDSYNTLIYGFCKTAQIDKALHLLRKVVYKGLKPNIITYNIF